MAILRIWEIGYLSLIPLAEAAYCPIPGFPCPTGGSYFTDYLGRIAGGIAGSIAGIIAGMLIFYNLKLAISGTEESNVTEVRTAYLHVIFGAVLIAGASAISAIVAPASTTATPGTFISNIIIPMKQFFFGMMGTALVINIGYNGARLIVSQDDSGSSNAKQGILRGGIGLTIVMLVGTVLGAFETNVFTGINDELLGAGNFIITIFGALAVVAMVIAAYILIVSADEQMKDRAKKIIITVGASIIVVMASAIIITTFF